MSMATIEVRYADPPKAGKKLATVKTVEGQLFGVKPAQLGLLQPGQTYKVEYSEREWQGRTYQTITKIEPASQHNGHKPQAQSSPDGEREFVTRILATIIAAHAIDVRQDAITNTVRMLRTVYRETMA
jgi:hypothetical protein